jgi:hypothetical protein
MNINLIRPVFHIDELYEIALFFILLFMIGLILLSLIILFIFLCDEM